MILKVLPDYFQITTNCIPLETNFRSLKRAGPIHILQEPWLNEKVHFYVVGDSDPVITCDIVIPLGFTKAI